MSWIVWTTVLVVLLVAAALAWRHYARRARDLGSLGQQADVFDMKDARIVRNTLGGMTVTLALVLVAFTLASGLNTVSTKNAGIETFGGSVVGELSNGWHFIAPWYEVHEMDAAVQTDSYTDRTCINVRIANQQTACVHATIRWRINPGTAGDLFRNYRSFDHVRDSLVTRELATAVNARLAGYNPLNSVEGGTLPAGQKPNPTLAEIAAAVQQQMTRKIGDQIEVLSVFIPIITFDEQTQARINQLQQQIALTRIAEQAHATASAQAKANQALAGSVSHAPNVLVAQCLEILGTMVKNSQQVPAGFSCWPGSGGLSGIIAPSK